MPTPTPGELSAAAAHNSPSSDSPCALVPSRLVMDAASDAMWIIRAEANGVMRTIAVNPAWEALTGVPASRAIGLPDGVGVSWPDAMPMPDRYRAVAAQGHPMRFAELVDLGGQKILETSLTPVLDASGVCQYILGVARDVTARGPHQEQKMHTLGMLAGGIAVEIGNMLIAIQGHLDMARRDGRRNPRVLKSLAVCSRACRSASDFTGRILAFNRTQPVNRQVMALTPVVEAAAALLRAAVQPGHDVEYRAGAAVPHALIDECQIQHAVINLGLHAGQWIADRAGTIRIHLDAVHATGTAEGDGAGLRPGPYARISVTIGEGTDPTITMAAAAAPRADDPVGQQSDAGLLAVREIVQAHEGALVYQRLGSTGGDIEVYFPAAVPHKIAAAVGAPKNRNKTERRVQPRGCGQRILLVDDQQWLLALLERLLTERGYQVRSCTDPAAALDVLNAQPDMFDLVVTDYKMPGRTGLDIIRAVRAIRPDLPLVLVSGYVSDQLREQAERAGAAAVIPKQYLATELLPALNVLFSNKERP